MVRRRKAPLDVEVRAKDKATKELNAISGRIDDFGKKGVQSLGGIAGAAAGMGAAITAAVGTAVAGVAALAGRASETAIEMGKLADNSGLAVETVAALARESEILGQDADRVAEAMFTLHERVVEASEGNQTYIEDIKRLGTSWEELLHASPDERLRIVSEAMQSATNKTDALAAASILMGDDAKTLNAIFVEQGLTLDGLVGKHDNLTTAQDVENARRYEAVQAKLTAKLTELGANVLPVVTDGLTKIASGIEAVEGFVDWLRNLGEEQSDLSEQTVNNRQAYAQLFNEMLTGGKLTAAQRVEVRALNDAYQARVDWEKLIKDNAVHLNYSLNELAVNYMELLKEVTATTEAEEDNAVAIVDTASAVDLLANKVETAVGPSGMFGQWAGHIRLVTDEYDKLREAERQAQDHARTRAAIDAQKTAAGFAEAYEAGVAQGEAYTESLRKLANNSSSTTEKVLSDAEKLAAGMRVEMTNACGAVTGFQECIDGLVVDFDAAGERVYSDAEKLASGLAVPMVNACGTVTGFRQCVDGVVVEFDENMQRIVEASAGMAQGVAASVASAGAQVGGLWSQLARGGPGAKTYTQAQKDWFLSAAKVPLPSGVGWMLDERRSGAAGGYLANVRGAADALYDLQTADGTASFGTLGHHVFQADKQRRMLAEYGIDVPGMADGGIVTRPTVVLAGEAGREAIVPLDRMGGMGDTYTVNIYAGSVIAEDDLERRMLDAITRRVERGALATTPG